jgi:RimJ/RimL family protein N-acetyltransferase
VRKHVQECPELSAIWVWPPEKRSQGVGRALIERAEELVKSKGYTKIGLGVRIENERAQQLYEKLGYKDWGHGIYRNRYTNFKRDGTKVEHDDPSYCLIKQL